MTKNRCLRKSLDHETAMNMTPMIDVVFLLIIFFMIVTDLSQQELEDLVLPEADMAQKDENPPEKRFVININRNGEYIVRRRNHGTVKECLDLIAHQLAFETKFSPRDRGGCSKLPVLIRADRATTFEEVQRIMQTCGLEGIHIDRIELACSKP